MAQSTRLFVGNLPINTDERELKKEFSYYGDVKVIEVKSKKSVDGEIISQFAFVTLETDIQTMKKCIQEFSQQAWKGNLLSVSIARENFLERLKRERAEDEKKNQHLNKKKKLMFDDEGNVIKESDIVKTENNIVNGNIEKDEESHKKKKQKHITEDKAVIEKEKKTLFHNDSDDSDSGFNFEVKEHFEGEAGQKLQELQSRYKSDKRFVLDERFVEEKEESDGENKATEKNIVENEEVDEKTRQIEILQGILGTKLKTLSFKDGPKNDESKKIPIKTMLRFDPTRPDHEKYKSVPTEPALVKKSKKEKKLERMQAMLSEKHKVEENAPPEVSQERYYKVNESLKKVMEEEKTPFSLLGLFGRKEEDDTKSNNQEEYAVQSTNGKLKNTIKLPNPFKYDSESDEEVEDAPVEQKDSNKALTTDSKSKDKMLIVNENFFFSDDDVRFKESLNFFLLQPQGDNNNRDKLRTMLKKRIQNNKRSERSLFKKVVQRHPAKTNKFRKK